MKIAVTGGAGFIGARLAQALSSAGHEVIIIDRVQPPTPMPLETRIADITSLNSMQSALEGVEVVYHLAGLVLDTVRKNAFGGFTINAMGTLNTLEACRLNDVRRFLFASTFYVYDGIPAEEHVNESTLVQAAKMELFGFTKLAGEAQIKEYARRHKFEATILRFGSAYGPGNSSNVVRTFIESALAKQPVDIWGSGARRNQYTFVDDIAQGCVLALGAPGETFNLISPETTTIRELVDLLKRKLSFQVTFDTSKKEGASMPYMSSEKAQKLLKWKPIPIEEGIKRTLKEQYGVS